MKKKARINLHAIIGLSLLFSMQVNAFQFEFSGIKDPVHQLMSLRALSCAIDKPDSESFCEDNKNLELKESLSTPWDEIGKISSEDIQQAVIWPDDPVREVSWSRFHRLIYWTFEIVPNACKNKIDGLEDGLRCSSHYGPLQFMHSMESKPGLPASDTKQAILDWIRFSYNVATNKELDDGTYFNDQKYCNYRNKKPEYSEKFIKAMFPVAPKFPCNPSNPLTKSTPWTLSTPFSFKCTGLFSVNCEEEMETQEDIRQYRMAALGAILHVIQDSYAKGHAVRGSESKDTLNIYECNKIKQFQLYGDQDHGLHDDADMSPRPSKVSCSEKAFNDKSVHGPITASAEVIRLFISDEKDQKVIDYLDDHVFILDDNVLPAATTEFF